MLFLFSRRLARLADWFTKGVVFYTLQKGPAGVDTVSASPRVLFYLSQNIRSPPPLTDTRTHVFN